MRSVYRAVTLASLSLAALLLGCAKPVEPPPPMGDPTAMGGHEAPADYPFSNVITKGEEVDLKDHLVSGKTTIVDFSSPACPPCVAIAPKLEALPKTHDDIAVIVVDINRPGIQGIDWDSPVAKQYQITSTPTFQVYDADGKLVAEGEEASQQVQALL